MISEVQRSPVAKATFYLPTNPTFFLNSDFVVPWSARITFAVNDRGVLEVQATWPVPEPGADPEFCTQGLVVIRASTMAETKDNITLDRVVGDFQYDGNDYILCTCNIEDEYKFVSVLKPVWKSGGFAYQTKMWLPPEDHFVSSSCSMLIEDNQDVSNVRFAVYMSFSSKEQTVECLLAVEPVTPDQSIYEVMLRATDEEHLIHTFTVAGLKRAVAETESDQYEEEV